MSEILYVWTVVLETINTPDEKTEEFKTFEESSRPLTVIAPRYTLAIDRASRFYESEALEGWSLEVIDVVRCDRVDMIDAK